MESINMWETYAHKVDQFFVQISRKLNKWFLELDWAE